MQPKELYLEAGKIRAYATRRVNPFIGVLQIIETETGRAVSGNGVVWQIDLLTEQPAISGGLHHSPEQAIYYRFGLWSKDEGLVHRPLAPQLDGGRLSGQCEYLIRCIEERLKHIPFRLVDNHELWLFDKDARYPVALLASKKTGDRPLSPEPKYWKSCLGANGIASQYRFPAARKLESLVERTASTNIFKYWVERKDDGSGIVISNGDTIEQSEFPGFLLTENWANREDQALVDGYIAWIAPSLLSLQNLTKAQRDRLEQQLHVQAVSIEHHWHLYPEVIDETKLTAARVQCRLQKTR